MAIFVPKKETLLLFRQEDEPVNAALSCVSGSSGMPK
jgi:hypothetical protein